MPSNVPMEECALPHMKVTRVVLSHTTITQSGLCTGVACIFCTLLTVGNDTNNLKQVDLCGLLQRMGYSLNGLIPQTLKERSRGCCNVAGTSRPQR